MVTPGSATEAPEIFLRTGYGKNSDVFSAGVVLYAMCGPPPFFSWSPSERKALLTPLICPARSRARRPATNSLPPPPSPQTHRLSGSTPWDSKDPWDLVQETSRMQTVNFERRRFDGVSEEGAGSFLSCGRGHCETEMRREN